MRLLLDTSIIIDFIRSRDKKGTYFYALLGAQHDLCVSIVSHTELYAGKSVWERPHAKQEVEGILEGLTVLPLSQELSKNAGKIKAYHHNIALADCIIASTAAEYHLPLATLNVKDFIPIHEVELFSLK